jgi:hypothetical protein
MAILRSMTALMLLLIYGFHGSDDRDNPLIQIVKKAMVGFSRASDPGAYWVDSVPLCELAMLCSYYDFYVY